MSRQKLKQINADRAAIAAERRAKILKLGAEGKSTVEIAAEVGLSPKTVQNTRALSRTEATEKSEVIRDEADNILRGLADFAMQSEEMTDKEIVDAVRTCWSDLTRLHGANAPERLLVGIGIPNRLAVELRQIAADPRMTVETFQKWVFKGQQILEGTDEGEQSIEVKLIPAAAHEQPPMVLSPTPEHKQLPEPMKELASTIARVIDASDDDAEWGAEYGDFEK